MSDATIPRVRRSSRVRTAVDSLVNLVSNFGTPADKNVANQYGLLLLTRDQLINAYRGDWIARKVVDIPAFDMTREWRSWQAGEKEIEKIEGVERLHKIQRKVMLAKRRARLFGGAGLVLGVGTPGPGNAPDQPLNLDAIKEGDLKFVHVINAHNLPGDAIEKDIMSPWYDEPKMYTVQTSRGQQLKIHPSRVVRFLGASLPDEETALTSGSVHGQSFVAGSMLSPGWGDSVLQALDDAIKNVGLTSTGIATMVHEANIDVIKIPGLLDNVGTTQWRANLLERLNLANTAKSVVNALLLDGNEEWERINANFTTLPDILKLYMLLACGAADIPATRMIGQSASGLNATGDGDIRNYYDRLSAEQNVDLRPEMERLDEVLLRSALGKRDPSIWYKWNPLWQLDETARSAVNKSKADTFKVDVDAMVIPVEVLREARQQQLVEDGTYPGLERLLEEAKKEKPADENDPEVQAAFEASKKPLSGEEDIEPAKEGSAPVDEVQKQALNGAQITSMIEVVTAVVEETMPPESAKAILFASFPFLGETEIGKIIDPLASFEAKEKPAPIAPFGGGKLPPGSEPDAIPGKEGAPGKGEEDKSLQEAKDAKPRTLYVRRNVKNAGALIRWAKEAGFASTLPSSDMHVTIAFSRKEVDWMKMGADGWDGGSAELKINAGGPRLVEPLGEQGAIVLLFASTSLSWRHEDMKRNGASWDFPEYQPHITISYPADGEIIPDLSKIEPYRGEIVLGPEIFEELDPDWAAKVKEKNQ